MTQGLGEAANLPWLSPCAASLVALARAPTPAVWEAVRCDPGAVLLLLRYALPPAAPPGLSFFPSLLTDPAPLEAALRHLAEPGPDAVDWDRPVCRPVYDASLAYARLAYRLAERTDLCAPDNAWVAGLLAPLGWLAACSIADCGLRIADCGVTPALSGPHGSVFQSAIRNPQSAIGFDPAAVGRRLNRLWRLPPWLAAVTGHLSLPVEVARELGADPSVFRVVQLAVCLAQAQGVELRLPVGADPERLRAELGLTAAELEEVKQALCEKPRTPRWEPPASLPLLPELLRVAAENRRLLDIPGRECLQQDIDALQRAVASQRAGEAERLRALKLAGLAELAAGAGHEINNPLAVISGQAQYLLVREAEPARRHSLQTIINQTKRIHHTLTELMQFARPPAPKRQPVDVAALLRQTADGLRDLAEQRQVRLLVEEPSAPLILDADPGQAQVALRCLLRNALEAAPAEGWASARARENGDAIELVVEDSGPGPSAADREHLFDPFYSGRKAGRGRGLGLPTAWRLAREHGGDVSFDDGSPDPTRFLLRLPRAQVPVPAADVSMPPAESEPAPERNGSNGCHLMPPIAS
jgi:signal transduction histidine kinase